MVEDGYPRKASEVQHAYWVKRNLKSGADPLQLRPYAELTREEKDKDRAIVRTAVEVYLAHLTAPHDAAEETHDEMVLKALNSKKGEWVHVPPTPGA